jgi:hypothetical protein
MPSILPSLQALRQAAVTAGDGQWDQAEVQQLTKLARAGGDAFTLAPAAKSFLTCELHGKAAFAPGARQTLTDVLASQAAGTGGLRWRSPRGLSGGPRGRQQQVLRAGRGGQHAHHALGTDRQGRAE